MVRLSDRLSGLFIPGGEQRWGKGDEGFLVCPPVGHHPVSKAHLAAIVVEYLDVKVSSLPTGAGIKRVVKYKGAFILFIGLRLNVAGHVTRRFQLESLPVCFLQQVEAVEGVFL